MSSRGYEKSDKRVLRRKLNSLELLILVLIQTGESSTYDLMAHAGMSPGLTGPVLKRMKAAELLSSESGERRVVRYALTDFGETVLRETLQRGRTANWWSPKPLLYESLTRSFFVIWVTEGPESARRWLRQTQEQIKSMQERKQREAEELKKEHFRIAKRWLEDRSELVSHRVVKDSDDITEGFVLAHAYCATKGLFDAEALRAQVDHSAVDDEILVQLQAVLQAVRTSLE